MRRDFVAVHTSLDVIDGALHLTNHRGQLVGILYGVGLVGKDEPVPARHAVSGDPRRWRAMSSAPRDGAVVELCARYLGFMEGSPRFGSYWGDCWRESSTLGLRIEPWAWRPREDWPDEGRELQP